MRCFRIFKKNYLIYKIFKIYIIFILIFSLYSFSGCLQNNINEKEEYQFINLSINDVNNSLNLAKKWLISNLKENGFSNYLYDYKDDLYLNEDNIIHQLEVTKFLTELSYQNNSIKELHRKNMEFIINNLYFEKNDAGYIIYNNKSDIISNAIFLRTILISPIFNEYQSYSYKIANTIISSQNENGSFKNEISPIDNDNETNLSMYYSEEIILSLIDMYFITNNNSYLNSAILFQDYFIDKYLINLNEKNYSVFFPGHSKSIKKIYDITKEEKYELSLQNLNKKLRGFQEIENFDIIGHFLNLNFNIKYYTDSSLDAYIINGISDLFPLLENDSNDYNQEYKISLILGIYNLINLQYTNVNEKINGAIRSSYNNHLIRIDSTQNTIEAYQNILNIFNKIGNWNYTYYPELDLLIENNQDYKFDENSIWYALFIGTIFSIITVVIIYIFIKINFRKK